MASAAGGKTDMRIWAALLVAGGAGSGVYGARALLRSDVRRFVIEFLTGPGRLSRILLLFFVVLNWKNMPLAWTFRVFGCIIRHSIRPRLPLPPSSLFHHSITTTRASLLETDYNLHKSNSTYFADLDTARCHLVMHLLGPGVRAVRDNHKTKLVPHPSDPSKHVTGTFAVALGAVACSFRREIAPYQGMEIWSRVAAWDRKWMYIVSHFVVAGKVRPAKWDGGSRWGSWGKTRGLRPVDDAELAPHVVATAVSKYVYKLGRITVHPAYLIEASGLLPERPGGWIGGESGMGTPVELDGPGDGTWDWKRVEWERRKGMEMAEHFAALDGTHALFDGGKEGALGRFSPG